MIFTINYDSFNPFSILEIFFLKLFLRIHLTFPLA